MGRCQMTLVRQGHLYSSGLSHGMGLGSRTVPSIRTITIMESNYIGLHSIG